MKECVYILDSEQDNIFKPYQIYNTKILKTSI